MYYMLGSFVHNFWHLASKKKLELLLKLFSYLMPIALIIWFITKCSINIPIGDHYHLIDFFKKISQGNADFKDFFDTHNEHRIFFPRIFFTILAFASNWNVKFETYLSILITIISFYLIYRIASVSQDYKKSKLFHLFNILTCFYIFSLSQVENWVWGFQFAWFWVNLCLILGVFVLTVPKKISSKIRLFISALCCFTASFSMAHGLFSWLAMIPSVLSVNDNPKQRRMSLLLWIILFIFCCFIYSIDYPKLPSSSGMFLVFEYPLTAIFFFLKLLGTLIINNYFAPIIGFFILSSFIYFNVRCIIIYRSEFSRDAAPWLSIGWFAIIFSLITTLGRVELGLGSAAASKYTTVSILLIISCLQLWRILISYQSFWTNKIPMRFSYFTAGVLVSLLLYSYTSIIPSWQLETSVRRNGAKTCFEVIYYLDESLWQQSNYSNCIWHLFGNHWSIKKFRDFAESLEKIGFRNFPNDLKFIDQPITIAGSIDDTQQTTQYLDLLQTASVPLDGWIMPIEGSKLPTVVLFSYEDNELFFASAFVHEKRPDVVEYYNLNGSPKIGWRTSISLKSLPLGEHIIKAWVYDRKNKQFIKLHKEVKIRVLKE